MSKVMPNVVSNEMITIILITVFVILVTIRIMGYYLDPREEAKRQIGKAKRQIRKISHSRIIFLYSWYNSLGNYIIDNEDKWMWELMVDERERRRKHDYHFWEEVNYHLSDLRLFLSLFPFKRNETSSRPTLISFDFPSAAWSCEKLDLELSIDDYTKMRTRDVSTESTERIKQCPR